MNKIKTWVEEAIANNFPKQEHYKKFLEKFFINAKTNIDLFILSLAIAFSNSYVAGRLQGGKTVEIRLEDFVISFLVIASIFYFIRIMKI